MRRLCMQNARTLKNLMISAYIFDLDGTLLDTLDDLADAVDHCLAANGLPERRLEEIRTFVGNGMRNLITRSVPKGTPEELFEKVFSDYREYYGSHNMIKTRPYEGINEALMTLKEKGIRLAVISNKADAHTKFLCSHFFPGVFDLVYGEREGVARKPDPSGLLKA